MSSHADKMLTDEIVPRLRNTIPHQVAFVGAEDAEEVLQDATLMAAPYWPVPKPTAKP